MIKDCIQLLFVTVYFVVLIRFLCEHYEGNPDQLNLVGSGNNGIAEMADQLDDTKYMYGIGTLN